MAEVALRSVRKVYNNGHVAVAGADVAIGDGELLVLVGPSGCGKSTLLRMIAGLEEVTQGTIHIGNQDVTQLEPRDRDIAMVFQSYALYPHMTVAENLGFGLKLRGYSAADIAARVTKSAAMLELEALLDRLPKQLSGGQRQRVALGRALVRQPQVFLLDEPLSNLDARLRTTTRTEIARLHRSLGTTMIYVTHDQVEAMTLGQRIVVMNHGVVQQIDTPMRIYAHPANLFVAGFLGNPAMNLWRGQLKAEGSLLHLTKQGHVLSLGSSAARVNGRTDVVVGVRPENVHRISAHDLSHGIRFEAAVDLVESVGSEAFIHARHGDWTVVVRVSPHDLPAAGATVTLGIAPESLHFFDAETGGRID
ncbi:multiple sugar transport system ATP-binding protein [Povalibacter uvarum]|uniref:Multiple sugar transport system ATP-binding protein n=1 Tax=Povalibacter uvarum TaxID=732238 RepID=A0A841HG05_9GAMM|nr:sn-glycerol-3-phosphate ABC transporter ATP-binding protein UgpC [Povalibacter uvarum]MBB6092041.1 multiple sugar transport system ATP-binding protein [Povalibacter uvarum]